LSKLTIDIVSERVHCALLSWTRFTGFYMIDKIILFIL